MLACAIILLILFLFCFSLLVIMAKNFENDSGSKASCIKGRMINAGVSTFCACVLILILLCESFCLFRIKLFKILFLFFQSFCFILNHFTSETFFRFSLSFDAFFLRHFSAKLFLVGFGFSSWFYLCLYFESFCSSS